MILVTGATGLLGSRLLFDLVSKGLPVRALRRKNSSRHCLDHYFGSQPDMEKSVEWITGDITDIFSLEESLEGITRVFHCAARVSFHPGDRDQMHHVNIQGTANLVNACLAKGIEKLCYVSSVAALGRNSYGEHIDETAIWKASHLNSSYAISKYAAEREVWRGVAEGLDAVIMNPGVIIGPGNWQTDSSMLFTRVNQGLKFYTSGITGFVDVRDVSRSMIDLMESTIVNERFIVVGENKPFRDVLDRIADKSGKPRPGVYAGPLLSAIAWRMEYLKWLITGKLPVITRETARAAAGRYFYSNDKIRKALGMDFTMIENAIDDTSRYFMKTSSKIALEEMTSPAS